MPLLNGKNYSIYTMTCNEHLSEASGMLQSCLASQNLNDRVAIAPIKNFILFSPLIL